MFDFKHITLFCLEKHFSKHKMTTFSKNWGAVALLPPLATPMGRNLFVRKGAVSQKKVGNHWFSPFNYHLHHFFLYFIINAFISD